MTTQTWPNFITKSMSDRFHSQGLEWNDDCSYRNTSPGTALKRHKEMYPNAPIKIVPC